MPIPGRTRPMLSYGGLKCTCYTTSIKYLTSVIDKAAASLLLAKSFIPILHHSWIDSADIPKANNLR